MTTPAARLIRDTVAAVSVCLLVGCVLICLLWIVPSANTAADEAAGAASEAAEVRAGNDAGRCRAAWSSQVTDARSGLDDAQAQLDDAGAQLDTAVAGHAQAIGAGLRAAVADDDAGYVAAVAGVDEAAQAIAEATRAVDAARVVIDERRTVLTRANDGYQSLIRAEDEDRPRFMRLCAAGPPT